MQAFLEHLDPYNQQRITFSDIIRLLSTQKTVTTTTPTPTSAEAVEVPKKQPATSSEQVSVQHHQESYNLRDSSMGFSDTAPHAMPLSEEVQNLVFFDKMGGTEEGDRMMELTNKSCLSQQY